VSISIWPKDVCFDDFASSSAGLFAVANLLLIVKDLFRPIVLLQFQNIFDDERYITFIAVTSYQSRDYRAAGNYFQRISRETMWLHTWL
jgi:hypothetical protein